MTDEPMTPEAVAGLRRQLAETQAELARLQTKPARPDPPPTYTRAQIADPVFFRANRRAILKAASEGRIVDDGAWKVNRPANDRARMDYRASLTRKETK